MTVAVRALSERQARALTAQIKNETRSLWTLIKDAYQGRVWTALGYDSWDAYLDGELGGLSLTVPREDRTEVIVSMRDAGMSPRAIASATGVSRGTVRNDLSGGQFCPPDEPIVATVVGLDGKTYAATRPAARKPKPTKPREPPEPERPGATTWSRQVQTISGTCPVMTLSDDEVVELRGAAQYLRDYCDGVLHTRGSTR